MVENISGCHLEYWVQRIATGIFVSAGATGRGSPHFEKEEKVVAEELTGEESLAGTLR